MSGRWRVGAGRLRAAGRPWLVLRARCGSRRPVERAGPRARSSGAVRRLGPDLLADDDRPRGARRRLRRAEPGRPLGEVLQDQRLVAGIGNMWMSEALWAARLSPWLPRRRGERRGAARGSWDVGATAMRAAVTGRRPSARGLPPRGPPVPALRTAIVARAGRATTTAPRTGARAASAGAVAVGRRLTGAPASGARRPVGVALRAPHLHAALRGFVLGAFAFLLRELDDGAELPVRLRRARARRAGPCPLRVPPARARVRRGARPAAARARRRADRARGARSASPPLRSSPARTPGRDPVRGRGALPHGPRSALLVSTRRGVRRLRLGRRRVRPRVRRARAVALRRAADVRGGRAARRDLRRDAARARARAAGPRGRRRASSHGTGPRPGSLPPGLRARDRPLLRARARAPRSAPAEDPPDAPAEIADAVSAIRLATAAPLAAGPVLFETLDGRPFGIRPVLPIAATQPPGEPTRLDSFRGCSRGRAARAARARRRRHARSRRRSTAGSSRSSRTSPFRSEQLRAALAALLGETWPLRAAVLLEEEPARRRCAARRTSPRSAREVPRPRPRPTWCAGRSSRRCTVATASRSCASSTGSCSAPAPRTSCVARPSDLGAEARRSVPSSRRSCARLAAGVPAGVSGVGLGGVGGVAFGQSGVGLHAVGARLQP